MLDSSPQLTTSEAEIKRAVQEFYDSVGWKQIGQGLYQNARYEDLRPVSRDYIHRCHQRVSRHLQHEGKFMLDAGSGPIQYPEYLEYSRNYEYRVCLDISCLALIEARKRIENRGLYVVGDIAHLPFKDGVFEGLVSLHAVHHLPLQEHKQAFQEFLRVLRPAGSAVVVSSWGQSSLLMKLSRRPIKWAGSLIRLYRKLHGKDDVLVIPPEDLTGEGIALIQTPGTFTAQHNYEWVMRELQGWPNLEIRVWRSVSNAFLRAFIHRRLAGHFFLQVMFEMEEWAPNLFGKIGQYPMILFKGG